MACMQDWNVPIDVSHQIARAILGKVRTDLIEVHEANASWEPSSVPADWHPSPDDHLQPRAYAMPLHVLGDRWLRPSRKGDVVTFYDYSMTNVPRRGCILEGPG